MDYTRVCSYLNDPSTEHLEALIGDCTSEGGKREADHHARVLFGISNLLPTPDSVVFCSFNDTNTGEVCGHRMKAIQLASVPEGFQFVCRGHQQEHPKMKISPRKDTVFHHSTLPPHQVLRIIVHFFFNTPVTDVQELCGISENRVKRWYSKLNGVMELAIRHDLNLAGGPSEYRKQVLECIPDDRSRLATFFTDIGRVYPGPNKESLKIKWDEKCHCEDCDPKED